MARRYDEETKENLIECIRTGKAPECQTLSCGVCGSVMIKKVSESTEGKLYKATHQCVKCGAVGEETQTWTTD